VILVDTSAWIEYLRATGSLLHHQLRRLIEKDEELATTDVIVMEVLAGGRDDDHLRQLRRLLMRWEFLPLQGLADYEEAASIYRQCRRSGETVSRLTDCLIAAVAIRASVPLLHGDKDFEVIARHTSLELALGSRR
jgi:predicted nucleic acid-binding protein